MRTTRSGSGKSPAELSENTEDPWSFPVIFPAKLKGDVEEGGVYCLALLRLNESGFCEEITDGIRKCVTRDL